MAILSITNKPDNNIINIPLRVSNNVITVSNNNITVAQFQYNSNQV